MSQLCVAFESGSTSSLLVPPFGHLLLLLRCYPNSLPILQKVCLISLIYCIKIDVVVVSLGDWEKGSCNVAPYDAEAIYRPLEVLTEEKRKQKALGLCDAFLVILLFLTVGYILMVNLGDPAVLTNGVFLFNYPLNIIFLEKTLSIEIIGKQNTTITPIYYSMIKGDNTRVKVALELSSPMIIDTEGTVFQVRNFTSKVQMPDYYPFPIATFCIMIPVIVRLILEIGVWCQSVQRNRPFA